MNTPALTMVLGAVGVLEILILAIVAIGLLAVIGAVVFFAVKAGQKSE